MPATRVVNLRRDRYDVYIGRGRGREFAWGNPFSHKDGTLAEFRVGSVAEAIRRYEAWLLDQPDLVERVKRELQGRILGCFCAPSACHGDVLVRVADEGTPWAAAPTTFAIQEDLFGGGKTNG